MLDCSPILSTFQVILLEHIIMCRLVTGHKATALQEVLCFLFIIFNFYLIKLCPIKINKYTNFSNPEAQSCPSPWLCLVSMCPDLTGLSVVPAVPQVIHQPCCSAPHSISEYIKSNLSLICWVLLSNGNQCLKETVHLKAPLTGTGLCSSVGQCQDLSTLVIFQKV